MEFSIGFFSEMKSKMFNGNKLVVKFRDILKNKSV